MSMPKALLVVGAFILGSALGFAAVWAISATMPNDEPVHYGPASDGITRVYFPAPHTERAYFMVLARELGN